MKIFIVFIIVLPSVLTDFYSSRYDDFDIQPLLENDRILLGYTRCFLDQGPCTPEAKDFKSKTLIFFKVNKQYIKYILITHK